MKTYSIGIMSSKWNVTAPSLDIATMTVRLAQKTSAPVVCYNESVQSKFASADWCSEEDIKAFCDENVDEIRIAYRTMEQVS